MKEIPQPYLLIAGLVHAGKISHEFNFIEQLKERISKFRKLKDIRKNLPAIFGDAYIVRYL